MFKKESGDWKRFRDLPGIVEVDLHYLDLGQRQVPYDEAMANVSGEVIKALKKAYDEGNKWVLFRHGSSTSRPGKSTARSEVRIVMRSPVAIPFIIRRECIQHFSVFLAAIRPKTGSE